MTAVSVRWLMLAGAALALLLSSSAPGSAQRQSASGGAGPKLALPQVILGGALALSKASKARRARKPIVARTKRPPPRPTVSKRRPEKVKTAKPSRLVSRPTPPSKPSARPTVVGVPTPTRPRPSVDRTPTALVPGALFDRPLSGDIDKADPPSRNPNSDAPDARNPEQPEDGEERVRSPLPRARPHLAALPPSPSANLRLGDVALDATEMPDEVLIVHLPATTDAAINALAQRLRLTVLERTNAALLGVRVVRLSIPDGRTTRAVIEVLAAEPGIEAAQPNHIYRRQQSRETATPPSQYAIAKLAATGTSLRASGRGVTIAVVDTGIDASHPDLKATAVELRDLLGAATAPADPAHATAIAGIIAADGTTQGIARGARIISLRAFAAFAPKEALRPPRSTSMVVLKAIDAAVAEGARVLNLSFAGPSDVLLERMLGAAEKRNVVAVAAAGNGGADAKPAYPAAYASVIAVTATDARDRLYEAANRGAYVTIAAPGVEVLAASADHGHELVSGTSFATAHVSGLAALLLELAPELTPADIRMALIETAVDLGAPGQDDAFGAGLANAEAALAHRLVVGLKP